MVPSAAVHLPYIPPAHLRDEHVRLCHVWVVPRGGAQQPQRLVVLRRLRAGGDGPPVGVAGGELVRLGQELGVGVG